MKRLLMVAYHFPPFVGSSGVHRALSFSSHLPDHGWEPIVLTAHPRAYDRRSDELLAQVREGTRVIRAPAWDTKRHLSISGRYPAFMSRPDRWRWWSVGAVPAGLWVTVRYKPDAIWSTYPIATAHLIAMTLTRLTGLPWIADFRDPMAQDGYPADPATWRSFDRIERRATSLARFSTFTTPGCVQLYRDRYPASSQRMRLLENGYDDAAFGADTTSRNALNPGRLTLLHSGVVYPSERDPTQLFAALRELRMNVPAMFSRLVLRFRAAEHEELLRKLAARFEVGEAIEIMPAVGHRAAVQEMERADGLLILQANNCNAQIPAKLYEYLRARRPMVVLADPPSDTAMAARAAGIEAIAALESAPDITALLNRFVTNPSAGTIATERAIEGASRRSRTAELARLLDEAAGGSR